MCKAGLQSLDPVMRFFRNWRQYTVSVQSIKPTNNTTIKSTHLSIANYTQANYQLFAFYFSFKIQNWLYSLKIEL